MEEALRRADLGRRPAPGLVRRRTGVYVSGRRRHTSFDCDWSSDVCSSDLGIRPADFRGEQLFDAAIGADRARQQAAGFLALEVLRRSEPALEAVAIRTNELKYDHVCLDRKSVV